MKTESENLVLKNVSVRYAKVHRPGKAYEETAPAEWSINLYVDDEGRDALMARGVNPKEDKDGAEYYIAKRSTKSRAGADIQPPIVVDAKKAPFVEDIGNGSVCNVAVTLFPWTKGKTKGVKLYLQAVQVMTHIAYNKGGVDAFDVHDIDNPFA
jgi:hypothetical protein